MRNPLRISLMLCVLGLLPATGFAQEPHPACRPARKGTSTLDILHPRAFVNISEVTSRGKRFVLSSRDSQNLSRFEVDENSTLLIEFDRAWISTQAEFEAEVNITAHLNGKPIEVQGYSVVGQEKETASARIRSGQALIALLCELESGEGIARQIVSRFKQAEDQARTASNAIARVRDADAEIADVERAIRADSSERLAAQTRLTTSTNAQDSANAIAAINQRASSIDSRRAQLVQLVAARKALIVNEYVPRALPTAVELQLLRVPLAVMTDTANASLISAMARRTGNVPATITGTAANLQSVWLNRLEKMDTVRMTAAQLTDALLLLENISTGLRLLSSVSSVYLKILDATPDVLAQDLVRMLKDTQVPVRGSGAKADDQMLVTITNGINRPELFRALPLDIEVRRFGFVQKTSDSFMFFHRRGIMEGDDPRLVAGRAAVSADGVSRSVELPLPVNYEPAPGVTFGWTYLPRASRWFARWLQPGFGANVSFPQFQTKTITLNRPDPAAPSVLKEDVTVGGKTLNLGVGLVATLFNNAIMAGWGRNLTADDASSYFSVGFSFVNLAKKVADVVNPDAAAN